jgi:hypothetical protein
VATLRPEGSTGESEDLLPAARPLSRITLFEFKTLDDNLGEDPIGDALGGIDPLIQAYDSALGRSGDQESFVPALEQLLEMAPHSTTLGPSHSASANLAAADLAT